MHLTEEEFWEMTPRAFFNAVEGMIQQKREDYELRRLQTFCQVAAWVKIENPQKLWKYTWETEEEKIIPAGDIEKQRERGNKLMHTLRNRG